MLIACVVTGANMSGLLALLDDVAAIAKLAAASVDDIAGIAAKAGTKAAGVVIDDAAVTPKYVEGLHPARELPIIGRIALGSLRNKLLVLLPGLLLLQALAPWAVMPLLMLGGAYLCFEGAEKIVHLIWPNAHEIIEPVAHSPEHLEESRVRGAIKTDFILSAEIMTIALAAIPQSTLWAEAAALGLVGVAITLAVYGTVAVLVKLDDIGLHLAARRGAVFPAFGRGLVRAMPSIMAGLSSVGTLAMLWVGGSIVLHGAEVLGLAGPAHFVQIMAGLAAATLPQAASALAWGMTAVLDGVFGLVLGGLIVLGLGQITRIRHA